MFLTKEEKVYIKNNYVNYNGKINLNGKILYLKQNEENRFLKEKLGEVIANKIGIRCAKYDIVDNIIVSEDLNNYGDFCDAIKIYEDTIISYDEREKFIENTSSISLTEIWDFLDKTNLNIKSIMDGVLKMYIMDILLLNSDRGCYNWGILLDKSEVCIFDNSEILKIDYNIIHSFLDNIDIDDKTEHCYNHYTYEDDVISVMLSDVQNFLGISSYEVIEIFKDILDKVSPEYLKSVMEFLEKEYNQSFLEKDYIKNYEIIRDKIYEMIERCSSKTQR